MAFFKDVTGDKIAVRSLQNDVRIAAHDNRMGVYLYDFTPATARAIAAALIAAADEAEAGK